MIRQFSNFLLFFSLILILSSCSEESRYTESELWNMAKEADPDIELVRIPNNEPERRILCRDYGPGCIHMSGRRLKVRMVEVIAVEFESTEQARKEAFKIDQYYARNWLFDQVTGEPVLEDFVTDTFNAKRPRAQEKDKETSKSKQNNWFYFF